MNSIATTIGTAYVQVLPSVEGIQNNLKSALSGPAEAAGVEAGEKTGGGFLSGLTGKAGLIVGGVTMVVGGALKAADKIGELMGPVADLGDEIDKNSQVLGVSAKAYQEWDAVLQHSGTSMDAMGPTFRTLQNAAVNASSKQQEAFEALGLSMEDVANMNAEELFGAVISGLQGMEEGSQRTAIATALLGRGAQTLGPLLNTSTEETQAMIDRVNELGGVMSDEAVKAGAAYNDALQDLRTAMTGVKNNLLGALLPAVTRVMNFITGVIAKVVNSGFFQRLQEKLTTLGRVLGGEESAWQLIWGRIKEAVSAAAAMIGAAVDAVVDAVGWLVEQVNTDGTFLNSAWSTISGIFNTASTVIVGIVQTLTAILHGDWSGALEIMRSVASNVWEDVKEAFSGFVEKIKEKVGELPGKMLEIGSNIVSGIWDGISDGYEWIKEKITGWVDNVIDFFKKLLGIKSPSTVFRDQVGAMIPAGMAAGIEDNVGVVRSAMDELNDAATADLSNSYALDVASRFAAEGSVGAYNTTGSDGSAPMGQLIQLLERWLPQLANMQVVLDNGVLAGELTPAIDSELGWRYGQSQRGVTA